MLYRRRIFFVPGKKNNNNMKVVTPGYVYDLQNVMNPNAPQRLSFALQSEGNFFKNTSIEGTTDEEVLKALADRNGRLKTPVYKYIQLALEALRNPEAVEKPATKAVKPAAKKATKKAVKK